MKRYLVLLLCSCSLVACTKEGLVGPQGPEGPEGPAGAPGTGSGGIATNIISVLTPASAGTYNWVETARTTTKAIYRLNWRSGTATGNTFRLPDSLTTKIDDGALLIYGVGTDRSYNGKGVFQLANIPIDFYDLRTYSYQVEKIAGRYVITVLAEMEDWGNRDAPKPMPIDFLKFVIIPSTGSDQLGWG
ncbi:hypothetical protein [Paraflavitalea pollutisoli]|uniref:hypothetical protein n=1 Tax=Paraflavitalea pollutisoli TaxID=3034143 RepID=UPI0023ECD9DB|nr:hypothetical protein [Paraflavitalea sp. H1-2-19X]